jgi:hypothetical protein
MGKKEKCYCVKSTDCHYQPRHITKRPSKAKYAYAAVEGDIEIDNKEFREVGNPAGSDPTYPCFRGPLIAKSGGRKGFDPVTGVFTSTAPPGKAALYSVSVWPVYIPFGTEPVEGKTTTIIDRQLRKNICGAPGSGAGGLNISIPGAGSVYIQSAPNRRPESFNAVHALIPLRGPSKKGAKDAESFSISCYQENDQEKVAQLFLELLIAEEGPIDLGMCRGPGCGT